MSGRGDFKGGEMSHFPELNGGRRATPRCWIEKLDW